MLLLCASLTIVAIADGQTDPGVRSGAPAAGSPMSGLSVKEAKFFAAGQDAFSEVASVSGTIAGTEPGLGPRFNLTSCGGCHAFPAVGGSSPQTNPQMTIAPVAQVNVLTALNIIKADGPVREVRFRSDGGVHDLFTIMGRSDTPAGCSLTQPDFAGASNRGDLVFRIPTPTFGLGLIEAIPDATILANLSAPGRPSGVTGHANRNGNDGTVTRFGWKAQNKSLVIFSGEAYNVEQGVTNSLFPDERGEGGVQDLAACRTNATPEDHVHYDDTQPQEVPDDANAFANFMRFLAPPAPVTSYTSTKVGAVSADSIIAGLGQFKSVGCAGCHVVSMQTGGHSSAALANKTVTLYSDLLVHNLGDLNGDGVSQGNAGGSEFRTAPLWGLGQRYYLLHDGRFTDLNDAIAAHAGEATTVIGKYNALSTGDKQNLLKFLRSL